VTFVLALFFKIIFKNLHIIDFGKNFFLGSSFFLILHTGACLRSLEIGVILLDLKHILKRGQQIIFSEQTKSLATSESPMPCP